VIFAATVRESRQSEHLSLALGFNDLLFVALAYYRFPVAFGAWRYS
jgi:hypothetical protein